MPVDPQLSRRALLAVGASSVALVAACGSDRSPAGPAASDPDGALVDEVVSRITAAALISGRVPTLTSMHAAHLSALEADPPTAGPAPLAQLRRTERELHTALVEASAQAESGPLARLFASMSAAVSQQLAVL